MGFNCNYGFSNTGTGCVPIQKVVKKLIFVPYFDSTGTVNTILMSGAPFNAAYFSALINQEDPSKRWFPTPFMKNASNKRADSIKKQYDDNTSAIVQQGVRHFSAIIVGKDASPQLLGKLLSGRTLNMGFYELDKDNNLIGMRNVPGQLDPIRIDSDSFDPIFNPGDDKNEPELMIQFDIHVNEIDANIDLLSYGDLASDVSMNIFEGLMDITPTWTNLVATSNNLTLQANTPYGSIKTPLTDKGLTAAMFVGKISGTPSRIYDKTTAADKTITSVTEGQDAYGRPNGIYTIVLSVAGTAADVLQPKVVRTGRDYTLLNVTDVTLT